MQKKANILLILALAQLIAWGCDIYENCCLLNWLENPLSIGNFSTYHFVVLTKWVIALTGALLAIPLSIIKRKRVAS